MSITWSFPSYNARETYETFPRLTFFEPVAVQAGDSCFGESSSRPYFLISLLLLYFEAIQPQKMKYGFPLTP